MLDVGPFCSPGRLFPVPYSLFPNSLFSHRFEKRRVIERLRMRRDEPDQQREQNQESRAAQSGPGAPASWVDGEKLIGRVGEPAFPRQETFEVWSVSVRLPAGPGLRPRAECSF